MRTDLFIGLTIKTRLSCCSVTVVFSALVAASVSDAGGGQPSDQKNAQLVTTMDAALAQEVSLQIMQMPLRDLATYLTDLADVRVVLDARGLFAAGIDASVPITFNGNKASLESVLNRMLKPLGLGWITEGNALLLTTEEVARTRVTTREYYVGDLAWRGDMEALVQLIRKSIDPPSWSRIGGEASIRALRTKIVVAQTHANQRKIFRLLFNMRRPGIR